MRAIATFGQEKQFEKSRKQSEITLNFPTTSSIGRIKKFIHMKANDYIIVRRNMDATMETCSFSFSFYS